MKFSCAWVLVKQFAMIEPSLVGPIAEFAELHNDRRRQGLHRFIELEVDEYNHDDDSYSNRIVDFVEAQIIVTGFDEVSDTNRDHHQ